MLRAIILLAIFLVLLTTSAQYEDFKSLLSIVGILATCAAVDWATKPHEK